MGHKCYSKIKLLRMDIRSVSIAWGRRVGAYAPSIEYIYLGGSPPHSPITRELADCGNDLKGFRERNCYRNLDQRWVNSLILRGFISFVIMAAGMEVCAWGYKAWYCTVTTCMWEKAQLSWICECFWSGQGCPIVPSPIKGILHSMPMVNVTTEV